MLILSTQDMNNDLEDAIYSFEFRS